MSSAEVLPRLSLPFAFARYFALTANEQGDKDGDKIPRTC